MENFFILIIALITCIVFLSSIFIVNEKTCAIVERFGKFLRLARPGIRIKIPFVDTISAVVSLKTHQLDILIETKTFDNVFVYVNASVQYSVIEDMVYESHYTLQDPKQQIKSFVFDVVRARVPALLLDDVFAKKDDIANAVSKELSATMRAFGYEIKKTLITDIAPDQAVKNAMNEINVAQRTRVAATERGEAEKIIRVKQAEAEAEAAILHGKGIAGQRQEIIEGLRKSIEDFSTHVNDVDQKNVFDLVLIAQYFDTLKELGDKSKSSVIFVQHEPDLSNISKQVRETIFSSKYTQQ